MAVLIPIPNNPKIIDRRGYRYGRWTVIGMVGKKCGRYAWLCRCDCGNESVVIGSTLVSGDSRSCGCLHHERLLERITKHGHSARRSRGSRHTPEYKAWGRMRGRCLSPTDCGYKDYGGRGIAVCERWQSFENFLADMGERPSPKHSLDRIDNDGNYEPGNCRWATRSQQANNNRRTIRVTIDGREQSLKLWAEELGANYKRTLGRVRRGADPKKALLMD